MHRSEQLYQELLPYAHSNSGEMYEVLQLQILMEQPVVYLAWRYGTFSGLLLLSFNFLSYDVSCDITKWSSITMVLSSVTISQTALKLPLNEFFHHARLQNHQNRKPHFLFVSILITEP